MSCPICSHTMQNVGLEGRRVFWCPRCGTLKTEAGDNASFEAPKLVGYIREAEATTVITSVDGRSTQYAVPGWYWRAACESAGVKAHELGGASSD